LLAILVVGKRFDSFRKALADDRGRR
jgi:hypothetical protein